MSHKACLSPIVVLLLVFPAMAQLQLGNNLSLRANGTVSAGYNADYGNQIGSDHSIGFGGSGAVDGYYYDPNFISFNVIPFYNQARDNSGYQSISNASGVSASSQFFGGSPFPGSINYTKNFNSEGTFAVPGLANYTSHGDNQNFGINWAANLPNLPSFSANFQTGSSQYSVYGTNSESTSDSHAFGLRSNYRIAGFSLGAFYSKGVSNSQTPDVLGTEEATDTNADNQVYGFTLGHQLPMRGSLSASYSSSTSNTHDVANNYSFTVDTFNTSASFQPTNKLHASVSTNYSNNLSGLLDQSIISAGGVVTSTPQTSSNSFDLIGNVSYSLMPNLQAQGQAERRQQELSGEMYGSDAFSGGLTYGRDLLGGSLNTSVFVTENMSDNSDATTLGFTSNSNYSRHLGRFVVNGSFSYSQNAETLLVTYLSSFYSYSGSVRRRFHTITWSAGAAASHTGLSAQQGTESGGKSFNTGLSFAQWLTATGSYSTSSGNAIQTGSGLTTVPIPSPILSSSSIYTYGGSSYSGALSSTPIRKMTIALSYAKARSNTLNESTTSTNTTKQLNTLLQYQFRKMYLTGGFTRMTQGFTGSGVAPQTVSAYYMGISRWFNLF